MDISKLDPKPGSVILARVKINSMSKSQVKDYFQDLKLTLKDEFPNNKVIVCGDHIEFSTIDLQKNDYAVANRIIPTSVSFDPSVYSIHSSMLKAK